jgi:hypothetical protein
MLKFYYCPNFCCDCGNKLSRKSWAYNLLPGKYYCAQCLNRLWKLILARVTVFVLLLLSCFLSGKLHFQPTSKYIQTKEIDQKRTEIPIDFNSASKQSIANISTKPCGAKTRKGGSCQRLVRGNNVCWQHRNKIKILTK